MKSSTVSYYILISAEKINEFELNSDILKLLKRKILKYHLLLQLQMLDQLQDFVSSFANTEMQFQLATITEKLQDVRLQRRKQALIKDFFTLKFSV